MRTKRNEHGSIDTDGLPSFVKHRQILLCAFPSYDNNLAPTTITVWADGTRKTYHTPIQKYMKAFFHERGGDFLSAKCELEHSYAPIPLDSCQNMSPRLYQLLSLCLFRLYPTSIVAE